jgi:glycosyltransferase involved in cell wall biosynthesis
MSTVLMAAYTNYARDPRVRREAEALVAEGYRVVFLARGQAGQPRREAIAAVEVIRTLGPTRRPDSVPAYVVDYVLFFLQLMAHLTLRPRRYRLIHISNMPDFLVLAAWLPRLLGTPVIHDVHDPMPELYMEKFHVNRDHWIIRLLMSQEWIAGRFATAVVTVEDHLKDILVGRGIPSKKISVLINLPDDKIFAPRTARRQKTPGEPFVIVYHGTLAHRFGLDMAIEAIPTLRQHIPDIELRIIGAGEERSRLIAMTNDLGVQDCVTFSAGFVPVEEIPGRIEDADIGLVPMRLSDATDLMLPTKLLEYVQVGIPCVVPRTSTIARYFDETMVRFFVADDSTSLVEALVDLHAHPEKRERLREAARERFVAKYTWQEHKKVYTQLVESLMMA